MDPCRPPERVRRRGSTGPSHPEPGLRDLVRQITLDRLSRRQFIRTVIGLGLPLPLVAELLASAGAAQTPHASRPAPLRRGGGGPLRLLWWQAPTILNPHLAWGLKDYDASRLFYEPLASFAPDGSLVPVLAAEVPSLENGGVAPNRTWVIWRLKAGVTWHDGRPFTADDVVFNWEYGADLAVTHDLSRSVDRVERLGDRAVRVVFKQPAPFWATLFCGRVGLLIPKHLFESYRGREKARDAPHNLRPVGTGPYRAVDFTPGDVLRAELNPHYHVPGRPFFDTVELKGGGDAPSAARAVLQTGDYDFAAYVWLVEDALLQRLEPGGKGRVLITPSTAVEYIECNQSDPRTDVDGERSSVKVSHPLLDPAVRAALSLLVDRQGIQEHLWGRLGRSTANVLNAPPSVQSPSTRWAFDVDRAIQLLESAGWKRGDDGVRTRDGRRLSLLFQTSVSPLRQKTQAIIKSACARAGVELELKAVPSSVFFSSDPANPHTAAHFYADLQMWSASLTRPDPQGFMSRFVSWQIASKANNWFANNTTRWQNAEYDRLWLAAQIELDPVKRAALFIRMNDLVIEHGIVIPIIWRNDASAVSRTLQGIEVSPWDSVLWNLASWYRAA